MTSAAATSTTRAIPAALNTAVAVPVLLPTTASVPSLQEAPGSVSTSMEDTTFAFAKAIALNNAGASHIMERGDYVSAIKALTASFLQFKKAYCHQKSHLISLRTHLQHLSTSATASSQTVLFNVDELFSWRKTAKTMSPSSQRRRSTSVEAASSSSSSSSPSVDSHLSVSFSSTFCPYSYRRSATPQGMATAKYSTDETATTDNETEQDVPSLYSNPILLPPDFPITQESCGFLSTTITMNLAIAHHLAGLELQEQAHADGTAPLRIQRHLISAGQYYEYTIRLERARQQEEQNRMLAAAAVAAQCPSAASASMVLPPLFISPLALLVVLNNLGQLHNVLSNTERSIKCYQQLQSTLMFLLLHKNKSGSTNNTGINGGSSKDLEVFMENATLGLQNMLARPAAPAA